MNNLLNVKDLSLKDRSTGNSVLNNISFSLNEKEILGVVGESGSGKTLLSQAIVNWLPENLEISSGHIDFLGKPHIRKLYITGTKKKIFFDYYKNQMQVISRSGAKKVINVKFKKNDMYMREIKYFLNCIKNFLLGQ